MQITQPTPATQPQKQAEMYFLDLAKSKVVMFAGKSCELVIFFGCLWITLVMTNPGAANWADGGINSFFLTSMGFAVDAAFPESWLYVVAQKLEGKRTQFTWSVAIAVAMLVLVAVNGVTAGAEGVLHVTINKWLLAIVIITRLLVGICYVAIRECQSFIDRRSAEQHQTLPAADVRAQIDTAIRTFSESLDRRFSESASATERHLQVSESRLGETIRLQVSESLATFSERLAESLAESLQWIVSDQVRQELQPVHDALQGHVNILETLASLPGQQAQLSMTVREVKATIERIPAFTESGSNRPKILSLKAGAKVDEASVKDASEGDFDKKAFVLACLSKNPTITISAIQQRAEELGQSISTGYISGIRKALAEERSA